MWPIVFHDNVSDILREKLVPMHELFFAFIFSLPNTAL